MKLFLYIIFFLSFSLNIHALDNKIKKKLLNKNKFIIIGLTIANPAISFGTVITNTGTIQKVISLANITYTSIKGRSIAEQAISKTTSKNCTLKNIAEKKEFCL